MTRTTLTSLTAIFCIAISSCGGGDGGGSPDMGAECAEAADCDEANGAPKCGGGAWACNDGVCQESCPECQQGDAPLACYEGGAGTENVGACRGGFRHCLGGVLGPCIGQVGPSAESCNAIDDDCDAVTDEDLTRSCGLGACTETSNCVAGVMEICSPDSTGTPEVCGDGIDDDCDGTVDEDCGAPCIYVEPVLTGGDDTNGDGSATMPYATIAKGIAEAAAAGIAHVCVASGDTCFTDATYTENIVMVNGVSVHGGYESTGWTRTLANPLPGTCATHIVNTDDDGINFDSSVTLPTSLDGFTIRATNGPSATTGTTAAVTIAGSTGAILSSVHVNAPSMDVFAGTTYGIHVTGGATPLIARSRIFGGEGSTLAIGVLSEGSTPRIEDNCDETSTGHCASGCSGGFMMGSSELAIRGHAGPMGGDTYGVVLQDSPGASVKRNVVCGAAGGGFMATVDYALSAGIRIAGDATGTVIQQNSVSSQGGDSGHGIQVDACGGAAPWIVANYRATGDATAINGASDGIRAMGDCHPIIERNGFPGGSVIGDATSSQTMVQPNGIHCGSDGTTASRCVVADNFNVAGHSFSMVAGTPATAVAIRCDDGSCARVERNAVGTVSFGIGGAFAQQGGTTYGIWLGDTNALVARNNVVGGCGVTRSAGIHAENSRARIENNIASPGILGSPCTLPTGVVPSYVGIDVVLSAGTNEPDVHSNDVFGTAVAGACTSAGIAISAGATAPDGPRGLFRNNILHAGICTTSYSVWEEAAGADPRVFSNNNLWPAAPSVLYRDENATDIADASMVGGTANLSTDPLFTNVMATPINLTLMAGSLCIDAGTTDGAPSIDFAGAARPQGSAPDIGALEATP